MNSLESEVLPGDFLQFSRYCNESVDETNMYFCWGCAYKAHQKNNIFVFKKVFIKENRKCISTNCYYCKEEITFNYELIVKNPYIKVKYILI